MGTAILYLNSSDERVLNKNLTEKLTLSNFKYKDDTNIIKPSIIVAYDSRIFESNYVYLSDFKRYYYITNKTVSQQRVIIDLEIDVRKTYENYLLNCDVIVSRQENKYNTYLSDDKFRAYGYSNQYAHAFSSPFTKNLEFVLTVQG